MKVLPYPREVKSAGNGQVYAKITEARSTFKQKRRDTSGRTLGEGQFSLLIDVTAQEGTVYIPLSIASSKKPTGFVYQIEGTGEGVISTANISCEGEGVVQVTLGTLLYAEIPQGSTATFRVVVDVEGGIGKLYKIVLNRLNYKLQPTDARYKKFDMRIESKALRFR